ncbi:MAG: radical SAM protein, partial [Verrucomicrobiota bacterium]
MTSSLLNPKGRGTVSRIGNRFEAHRVVEDGDLLQDLMDSDPDFVPVRPETQIIPDDSQSIITENRSPDLGFNFSLNPYRGCEHGCSYCYARPYHEYLGYDSGLDFETKLMVKKEAPHLLEHTLAKPSWSPAVLACSGVTDCYQPIERDLQITRECLEVLANFRNPVGIITKNALVTRDIDILQRLAHYQAVSVTLSLTSLDTELAGKLEPRASRPASRLKAIRTLRDAGIPVGISLAPVIPGLNDHEIPAILQAARESGAEYASYS